MMCHRVVVGVLTVCAGVGAASAQPLTTYFTYHGDVGNPGTNGLHDLQFRLYDAVLGGGQVGPTLCADDVSVSGGLFEVSLDFGAAFDGQQRFIEIDFRTDTGATCAVPGGFTTLADRRPVEAVPYALYALDADHAAAASDAGLLNGQPASFYQNAANLTTGAINLSGAFSTQTLRGVNSSNTTFAVGVRGVSLASNAITYGVWGESTSTQGRGVIGYARSFTGASQGVLGRSDSNAGIGVLGVTYASSGSTHGGYFSSASVTGTGVYGLASASSGNTRGVYGYAASASGKGVYGLAPRYGVYGQASLSNGFGVFGSAPTYGVYGEASQAGGYGVYGDTVSGTGVYGDTISGTGVYGRATAISGNTVGVSGSADGPSGKGVFGFAPMYGVYGQAAWPEGHGVHGVSTGSSASAIGVYGEAPNGTGMHATGSTGGRFYTTSLMGRGVQGSATTPTGGAYGVWGSNTSAIGAGVIGIAFEGNGEPAGVQGQTVSPTGRGVLGEAIDDAGVSSGVLGHTYSESGRGVCGEAKAASGIGYGVYGIAATSATGYAVYAAGDLGASGVKSFRIDHPDDPENMYLLHYSAESPEVINFYSGKVMLDGNGEAVVTLPAYFAKINTDPRYLLTAVGAPMPMLHVAQEIDEGTLGAGATADPGEAAAACWFRIAGGVAGGKVSWEVKAVRNDPWVRVRGAPVVIEKQLAEQGRYQHPEFYGKPAEMGQNYDPTPCAEVPVESEVEGASGGGAR
ncbi:hypothetical protein PHYC_00920 [Phycisphaerales bacterium]|nr:hypothetical protein PHYC_00920 [Phycisphaerales bacterium]